MAKIVRFGRVASWITVLIMASATTLAILGVAAVALHHDLSSVRSQPEFWLLASLAALAALIPWWAMLAAASQSGRRMHA